MRQSMMLMMLAFFASGCAAKTTVTHHSNGSVTYDSTGLGALQANREAMAHDSSRDLVRESGNVAMDVDSSGLSLRAGYTTPLPVDNDGWQVVQQGVAPAAPLPMDLWSDLPAQPVYPTDSPVGAVTCPKSKDWEQMSLVEQSACAKLERDYLFDVTDGN